jgi:hypothetical protein
MHQGLRKYNKQKINHRRRPFAGAATDSIMIKPAWLIDEKASSRFRLACRKAKRLPISMVNTDNAKSTGYQFPESV